MYLAHLKQIPVKGCKKKSIRRKEERRRYKKELLQTLLQTLVSHFSLALFCVLTKSGREKILMIHSTKNTHKKTEIKKERE